MENEERQEHNQNKVDFVKDYVHHAEVSNSRVHCRCFLKACFFSLESTPFYPFISKVSRSSKKFA